MSKQSNFCVPRRTLITGAVAAAVLFLSGCDNGSLPLSEYDNVDVNAYFYYPNGTEAYLGRYHGASACGRAARGFARQKKVVNTDWSYICCTIRNGSSCHEKIR